MKRLAPFLVLFLAVATISHAQWITRTYTLKPGWNGIWLAGDASYTTVNQLLPASDPVAQAVSQIWRWNPNPDQVQFSQTPSTSSNDSAEWTVWNRHDPDDQLLSRLVGNSAYLFYNEGTSAISLPILQKILPPSNTWLVSGANFMGFPSGLGSTPPLSTPTISTYFASFISGSTPGLPPGTKVYKYIGGDLGTSNPLSVVPASEPIDASTAYWFSVAAVSTFTGPFDFEVPSTEGIAFGRTLSSIAVGVSNRTTVERTLTFTLNSSAADPTGLGELPPAVPLTRRVFDTDSGEYVETPVPISGATDLANSSNSVTLTLPANGHATIEFGLTRSQITAAADTTYASILRVRDTAGLSDVRLPVSALPTTPSGLWICTVDVTHVGNTSAVAAANSTVTTTSTSRAFPLQYLVHLDAEGQARLLRQVFLGRLATTGNALGLAVIEARVLGYDASDVAPLRFYSPLMPASGEIPSASATFTVGSATTWEINHGYRDPVNPFLHTYHPDHDNLDAKFSASALPAGVESYDIGRTVTFTFSADPPDGSSLSGWGTTILGGTYTETITGLHKEALQTSGSFTMRRISEIADIDTSTEPLIP